MDSHLHIRSMPSLCFNRDDFMADEFSVDRFVSECRKCASLETMREHLNMYHKILCTAMVELINKDYADFVNLSSNLVGLDKLIKNLSLPLHSLKNEIDEVKNSLDGTVDAAHDIFSQRSSNHASKVLIHHVLCVLEGLDKIADLNSTSKRAEDPMQLETLERIAFLFNTVKFHMQKVSDMKELSGKKEEVQQVAKSLEKRLESAFLHCLPIHDTHNLHKILRIYSVIAEERKAENCFREAVVTDFMKNHITQTIVTKYGLATVYKNILEFIPNFCSDMLKLTRGSSRGTEAVAEFDFLVNAVWPEIFKCFESISPVYLYSLGDPQLFHQNYTSSMKFLSQFETFCGTQSSVQKLRTHSSYKEFIAKWNLDVYFQIRFQEIAGEFETTLLESFAKSKDENLPYTLNATSSLWTCVNLCWSDTVFLPPLLCNFWKLTLQLLSRFKEYSYYNLEHIEDGAFVIALLIKDVELLVSQMKLFFAECIYSKLKSSSKSCIEAAFNEALKAIEDIPPFAGKCIVKLLIEKCTLHLKWIANIPQRFRKTNREIPSNPSPYVSQVLSPLTEFLMETKSVLPSEWITFCEREVIDGIMIQCMMQMTDVLTSIKKMEDSLKILKRARDKPTAQFSSGTVTDDDKIRRQLSIDVSYFEELISKSGLHISDVKSFKELKKLVTSAERVPGFPVKT